MDKPIDSQGSQGGSPAVYRITVQGRLDTSWSDRLAGIKVMPVEDDGSGCPITVLEGPVRDQAELTGILNALYEWHLPLLGVEVLDKKV